MNLSREDVGVYITFTLLGAGIGLLVGSYIALKRSEQLAEEEWEDEMVEIDEIRYKELCELYSVTKTQDSLVRAGVIELDALEILLGKQTGTPTDDVEEYVVGKAVSAKDDGTLSVSDHTIAQKVDYAAVSNKPLEVKSLPEELDIFEIIQSSDRLLELRKGKVVSMEYDAHTDTAIRFYEGHRMAVGNIQELIGEEAVELLALGDEHGPIDDLAVLNHPTETLYLVSLINNEYDEEEVEPIKKKKNKDTGGDLADD